MHFVTNLFSLPLCTVFKIFLYFLVPCSTSLFFTRSVQLISILHWKSIQNESIIYDFCYEVLVSLFLPNFSLHSFFGAFLKFRSLSLF